MDEILFRGPHWPAYGGGITPLPLPGLTPQEIASLAPKACSGEARVLKGNPATIGAPLGHGAFNYMPNPVPVRAGSAAVDPRQFGFPSNAIMKPYISQIRGEFGNGVTFNGVTDVIGSTHTFLGFPNVRDYLEHTYPGKLIIELPSAPKDYGDQLFLLTIPSYLPCPAGTWTW